MLAEESVCIATWPRPLGWDDPVARQTVDYWQQTITAIRTLKAERDIPKDARIAPILVAQGPVAAALEQGEPLLRSLLSAESVTIVPTADRPQDCAVAVLPDVEIILPLEGLIDREAEKAKQTQSLEKSLADLDRQIGPLRAKLNNESFVARAPADVVEQTRVKLAELEARDAVLRLLNRTDRTCARCRPGEPGRRAAVPVHKISRRQYPDRCPLR